MSAGGPRQGVLPDGPRMPRVAQMAAFWTRPISYFERNRARYGKRFTARLPLNRPVVVLSDPDEVKAVFTAPPDVLRPGVGAGLLEPIVGRSSVLLLDGAEHLSQRKLMLPAFHGERMESLSDLIGEVTEREVASWPADEPLQLHERFQALTLEVILRAVFGLDPGPRLEALRERLTAILEFTARPESLIPALQLGLGGWSPWAKWAALREETDGMIADLVADRRNDAAERDDVLSMLLAARHEDGSPMSGGELRDELMTLLIAGHETTASQLSWAFATIAREPRVSAVLVAEIDSGDADEYLNATLREVLRRRPVLPGSQPRYVAEPFDSGLWVYPADVSLQANTHLIHHDPTIYPDPYAFRPERFIGREPGTYTWIPFGGGRRRCLGASFATLEMKIVLRTALATRELRAPDPAPETAARRAIAVTPRRGARISARPRSRAPIPV